MSTTLQRERTERASMPPMRELADQAFSRAAGAPLVEGNSVRLLIDARENYPAWLEVRRRACRESEGRCACALNLRLNGRLR